MKKLIKITFNRILFRIYEKKLNSTISSKKKIKFLNKAYKSACHLPEIESPYKFIHENLNYSKNQHDVALSCYNQPKSILKYLKYFIGFNLIYLTISLLFFNDIPFENIRRIAIWVFPTFLFILALNLPRIYWKRYIAYEAVKNTIKKELKILAGKTQTKKKEIAQITTTNYQWYSLMNDLCVIGGNRKYIKTALNQLIHNFFRNKKKFNNSKASAANTRFLRPLSEIDEEIKERDKKAQYLVKVLEETPSTDIYKIRFSGTLKGEISINIKPDVLKKFFYHLNGKLYTSKDLAFIDDFISETFNNNCKINEDLTLSKLLDTLIIKIKKENYIK